MDTQHETLISQLALLKAAEVAGILRISRSLAYQLMQSGAIPTVRINRSVRVRSSDLVAYIKMHLTGLKES